MSKPSTAFLHYSAPPVIGGVESVIEAHTRVFQQRGYPATVIAGRGSGDALPAGVDFQLVPEMDSLHPQVQAMSPALDQGHVPAGFDELVQQLARRLDTILEPFDSVVVHNIFTKHFNLPLTAALDALLASGRIRHCIAWCHDFSWTSPSSRVKVHPGHPWDLLRRRHPAITYVVVSQRRQQELSTLFGCPQQEIQLVYNGVDSHLLLGLSEQGGQLVEQLEMLASDPVLLMPVRVTRAKNIEYAFRVVAALKALGGRPKLVITGPPDPHDAASMAYYRALQALRSDLDITREARFVFESGPSAEQPHVIGMQTVAELFRASDLMFMPSHREGFGMPVLEAALLGLPVVSTDVPAAVEIGGQDILSFDAGQEPQAVAEMILTWTHSSPTHRFKTRVRHAYSWQSIFDRAIKPLLQGPGAA